MIWMLTERDMAEATGGEWMNLTENGRVTVESVRTDSRRNCDDALFLALTGENFDGHDFLESAVTAGARAVCVARSRADLATRHPEIPALLVEDTLDAYQALARCYRRKFSDLRVIGLTGSSGKTSAKEMLRTVFQAIHGAEGTLATEGNTNNQVGVPQNLFRLTDKHKVAIIEMGSNHPGEIESLTRTAEPDAALITSIGPCHLEFFGDLDGVAAEKASIVNGLRKGGLAAIPFGGPGESILAAAASLFKTVRFGREDGADVRCVYDGGDLRGGTFKLIWKRNGREIDVSWSLRGAHQAVNAAGAAVVAEALGVAPEAIAAALVGVELPGFRSKVFERDGVTWINDAYNANPDSVRAGLTWLAEFADSDRTLLVLGDMLELGAGAVVEHRKILTFAEKALPGATILAVGPLMSEAAEGMGVESHANVEEAGVALGERSRPGATVYLKASRGMRLERLAP